MCSMGQILSNFVRCVCGEADEEEREIEQSLLISPPIADDSSIDSSIDQCINSSSTHSVVIDSSIQFVEDNMQVSLLFPNLNTREPIEEEEEEVEEEELIISKEVVMKEGCSHSIQVVEDNTQVSCHFPHLKPREPTKEDQAEEDNEETKLTTSKKLVMKQSWILKSHSIQAVVDNDQVSLPFSDLNTREPKEGAQGKEEKIIKGKQLAMKQRWIQKCSSSHIIPDVEDNGQVSLPSIDLNTREENQSQEELAVKQRSIQNCSCFHSIQDVEDSKQISLPSTDLNTREPREEDQRKEGNENEKLIVSKKVTVKQRWIQKCSSPQRVQVLEDSRQVSLPFPDLNTREQSEDDQIKEDNEEEKVLIDENLVMKQRWIQKNSSSHGIQVVEEKKQASPPFPDLNTKERREEDQVKEGSEEEEKVVISKKLVMKQRWIQKYSSSQSVQAIKDIRQVSLPSIELNTSESTKEDQAKEEDNKKEEKLITSKKMKMKQRRIQNNSCSDGIQVVEDNRQVSQPFHNLNTRKPIEEFQAKKEDNEEEKLIISKKMAMKQTWIQKCSSPESVQVVEDSRQDSPLFSDLNTREPREEDETKEEDNEEKEKQIIGKKMVMKQRWIQKNNSPYSIQVVEDNSQVSLPFPDLNSIEPREEYQVKEEEKLITGKKMLLEQRWIQKCSSPQSIHVVDDSMQVSPPFPNSYTREPRAEVLQAQEEDNEGEKLIIREKMVMKQGWIQKCYSPQSVQVVEDRWQVSPPFTDLNTGEPREVDQVKEEEKLIIRKEVAIKERWMQHYSSSHKILLVGEGDFSFSASLALAFGSSTNMVATSLDSTGFLCANYKEALSNIHVLNSRGCRVMHGLDATEMAEHYLLKGMTFDRIIFNFPLVGFFPSNSRESEIRKNQALVLLFLANAKKMISYDGEIHIAHKSWGFFLEWNLQLLASIVGLELIEELPFDFRDYKGYHTKYGFEGDKNFNCNPSKVYKFGLKPYGKGF